MPRDMSGGHIARFQDDHRRLGRPPAPIPGEPWIDRHPAPPQPITLASRGRASCIGRRKLVGQSNHGVWVCRQVEPPRGSAFVPAVHSEQDEVWTIFEVANDHAALFPGPPSEDRKTKRTPASLARRGPLGATVTESVERSMNTPGVGHEPRRRMLRSSRCRGAGAMPLMSSPSNSISRHIRREP
jgi:hypothetical protein